MNGLLLLRLLLLYYELACAHISMRQGPMP